MGSIIEWARLKILGHDTASLAIGEVGPTVLFVAAFDGNQSVGTRFRPAILRPLQPGKIGCARIPFIEPALSAGLCEQSCNCGDAGFHCKNAGGKSAETKQNGKAQ